MEYKTEKKICLSSSASTKFHKEVGYSGVCGAGFVWLSLGASGGFVNVVMTLNSHNKWGIYRLRKRSVVSQ